MCIFSLYIAIFRLFCIHDQAKRVNAETFYDGLIIGITGLRGGQTNLYLKSECEPRVNSCIFATLSRPFVTHETSACCVRITCLYFLLSVSLSGSLAFLCSRDRSDHGKETWIRPVANESDVRLCVPSLILSHDRNLFAYDFLYFYPLDKPHKGKKYVSVNCMQIDIKKSWRRKASFVLSFAR